MRILFTFTGGSGHFLPALPIARAAAARGHAVLFSGQEAMLGAVRAAGFSFLPSGGPTLADPAARGPLGPVDRIHEEQAIRDTFAGRTARDRTARLLDVAARWRPEVIVRDEVDFGAAVAAERLGLPHAAIVVLAAGGLIRPDLIADSLDLLRAEHGLPADPRLEMLHRRLTLVPVPPSYRNPLDPLPATAHHIQPSALDPRSVAGQDDESTTGVLAWLAERPGRPTAYITLGTVFNQESGDLFARAVTAVAGLDVDLVVTVGREIDPRELGLQPPNVRIASFVPQGALLPHCDVVVCHAGSGSVIGALALGVPLVLLPLGADQPLNADRCESLGVARVLDPVTAGHDDIARAVLDVLADPLVRAAAERIRDEAASLPTAVHAVALIEALT